LVSVERKNQSMYVALQTHGWLLLLINNEVSIARLVIFSAISTDYRNIDFVLDLLFPMLKFDHLFH